MRCTFLTSLALSLAAVPALAAPAAADTLAIDDPADDASRGPDIVGVTVKNLDRAVVAKVELAEVVRGDVVVSVDPRGGVGVRMVSEYQSEEVYSAYVVPGAFTDGPPGGDSTSCRGFRVRWNEEDASVTMRLPSRCLAGGDYRAIRFGVLTERGGGDADFAPHADAGTVGSSAWIARG